jgi:hypothetical protein
MAQGADMSKAPDQKKAREIADALVSPRIQKGEELRKVAAEFNDDPGGKERGGDLGWIHRGSPNLLAALATGGAPAGRQARRAAAQRLRLPDRAARALTRAWTGLRCANRGWRS